MPDLNKPPPAQPARHSTYEPSQSCRYPENRKLFDDQSHPESEWVKDNPDIFGNLHPYPGLDDIYTWGDPSQSYGVGDTPYVTQKLYGFGDTSQDHWLNYDQPYSNLVDDIFGPPPTQSRNAPIYESRQAQVSDPESEAQSSASWVGYVAEPYNASLSKNYDWVLGEIPSYLRPYVVGAQNVKGDGNCGFRATAVALGLDEEMGAEWVRTQMLAEFESDLDGYMQMFGQTEGNRMLSALRTSYYGRSRPMHHWMSKVWFHILLANKLGIIVNCVSLRDPRTVFPMHHGLDQLLFKQPISIALINNETHFVAVKLAGDYPMAYKNPEWEFHATDPARRLALTYANQENAYQNWLYANMPRVPPGPPIVIND